MHHDHRHKLLVAIELGARHLAGVDRALCDILAELDTDSYPHHSDDPMVATSGHTSPVEAAATTAHRDALAVYEAEITAAARHLDAALRLDRRWRHHPSSAPAAAPPPCEHCARHGKGDSWPTTYTDAGRLGHKMRLCRGCRDWVATAGRLPSAAVIEAWRQGRRPRRPIDTHSDRRGNLRAV